MNEKELKATKARQMTSRANLVQDKFHKQNAKYNNKKPDFMPKANPNPTFKKKGSCFVCGKSSHHAPQCKRRMGNDNPPKPKANLVEGDDIIVAIISQVCLMANVKEW